MNPATRHALLVAIGACGLIATAGAQSGGGFELR